MAETIVVEFDNTLADHLAAERLYYSSTFWSKGDKIVAVAIVVAIVIFAISRGWLFLVLLPLAPLEWFGLLSPYRLRTALFFKRNPKFLETYHLSFSDGGIHFQTASINSRIAWTHYSRTLEDRHVILLVYGTRMYTVIPKRAFGGSSQIVAFEELIDKHLSGPRGRGPVA